MQNMSSVNKNYLRMIYLFESYLPDRAFVYRSTETELFIHTRHDVSQLVNDN